jgi:hypothetical protein
MAPYAFAAARSGFESFSSERAVAAHPGTRVTTRGLAWPVADSRYRDPAPSGVVVWDGGCAGSSLGPF